MASDEEYMAFLNKANEDTGGASAHTTNGAKSSGGHAPFKTADSEIPPEIKKVCDEGEFLISDTDEPFVPVSLKWEGEDGLPDEVQFAKLIHHWDPEKADVSIMDFNEWDTNGKSYEYLEAVQKASRGNDVRVYKLVVDKVRVEYWVLSTWEGKIIGVKALSVES